MTLFQNQTFVGQTILLDGNQYFQCRFERCVLRFTRGDFSLKRCPVLDCEIRPEGEAKVVAQFLADTGAMGPPPRPPHRSPFSATTHVIRG